jgi:hypothetical protein
MQCGNYPFASYFQGKIELIGIRSATLGHGGLTSSFASEKAADLADDLTGIYPGVTGRENNPHGIAGPGNQRNPPFV